MKKAFTMLELVFVIVIVGIISVMIAPSFGGNNLRQAADQVVSHIRYTQHLAMMDNKFDRADAEWFKGRWQIRFFENLTFTATLPPAKTYNNIWAYTIYSDLPNYASSLPDLNGMAKNVLSPNGYMSGGYNNTLHVESENSNENMRLNTKYGIEDIRFTGGCRGGINHVSFDYVGRPFNNYITSSNPYGNRTVNFERLIEDQCIIQMCTVADCTTANTDEIIQIAIEPETGYTHIL